MSKGRDFRPPRKRGFDDDGPSYDYNPRQGRPARSPFGAPPGGGFPEMGAPSMAPSSPPIDATVKWFKADKGFGFVELGNGTGDAFLHIGAVQQAGYDNDAFCLAFDATDTQAQTQADFAWVSQLAVRGFPTLLAEHQQQYALITNGYQTYAALEPLLSRRISINAST